MLILQDIQEPTEDVRSAQPQVVAYWEKNCLGQGTLFLTTRVVVWIADSTKKGFRLTYPAISVHAASGYNEDFPEPCLFLMIDVNKTDIEYTPDEDSVEDEAEEEDDSIKTAAIRFVPSDPSAISQMFEIMNDCQEQNPEDDDDMSDDSDELGHEMISGNGDQLSDSGQWFTSDNTGDEIHLSAEGRNNLERMIGNLHDHPDEPAASEKPDNEGHENGDGMEES